MDSKLSELMADAARRGRIETLASTSEMATHGDEIQYEAGEGPCLQAIWKRRTVDVPDISAAAWPTWAKRMIEETEFRSMLVFQLFTESDNVGALNLYSSRREGFDDDDRDYGAALAAHIAVAVSGAQQIESLRNAVDSRTTIGIAIGIVMERYGLDQDTAFQVLNRLASSTETKVRDLAAQVVGTGQLPETPESERPT